MTSRIDRIYYFDYTRDIGHYDSIRDFSSEEMSYIGLALSTPKVHVSGVPNSFGISSEGSNRIREYAISHMNSLEEIEKDLAENSPKYIFICYFDGSERYFAYNEEFCELFKLAFQYEPYKEKDEEYVSPFAIQNNNGAFIHTNASSAQNQTNSYTARRTYSRQGNIHKTTTAQKDHPFPKWKLIVFIGVIVLIFAAIIYAIVKDANVDAGLTPVSEPQSGAILVGREVYDGSEITVTASGGESCVVKLKTRSGAEKMSFYVRAGDTVTVGVPAEYLYVYFASGDIWYGTAHLFGEKTSYSMDDEIRDFTEYPWEYTLYPVSNGNFSQTPIDEDDFK